LQRRGIFDVAAGDFDCLAPREEQDWDEEDEWEGVPLENGARSLLDLLRLAPEERAEELEAWNTREMRAALCRQGAKAGANTRQNLASKLLASPSAILT
jgi:hypothetical protein